jgi:hypothetical protein
VDFWVLIISDFDLEATTRKKKEDASEENYQEVSSGDPSQMHTIQETEREENRFRRGRRRARRPRLATWTIPTTT